MRTALVTGGRRGIGLGIAEALSDEGWYVVITGTSDEAGDALARLREGQAEYVRCDISDTAASRDMLDGIVRRHGSLDLLINNAGVAPKQRMDILSTTEESYDYVTDTNLRGTFFMCQHATNLMIRAKAEDASRTPRIVNISSISSYTSSVNRGEYCISKAGISMVTSLFADRLAEYGIPVFEVRPGIILTDMTSAVKEKYLRLIEDGLTPINRIGTPKDVADCVLAASSGRLDFATGQVLNADGGFHLRRL
ncbi:MAG: 3-ketoacyl-ACP reductase [Eubacteriales bacterium]